MKTVLLFIALFSLNSVSAQEDSIYTAIFIAPLEELIIHEADSIGLIEEPLLIDELQENFEYTFFISGIDTLNTSEIEISFTYSDSLTINNVYTLSEIDSSEELERMENSVFLPLGTLPFLNTYSFTATIKDSEDNILETRIDSYSEE